MENKYVADLENLQLHNYCELYLHFSQLQWKAQIKTGLVLRMFERMVKDKIAELDDDMALQVKFSAAIDQLWILTFNELCECANQRMQFVNKSDCFACVRFIYQVLHMTDKL